MQIQELLGDIPNFRNGGNLPEVTKRKLLQIVANPQQVLLFKIQLAATVDAMEPFVKGKFAILSGVLDF